MLAYLSRYTHRVAISNRRLIAFDETGVTFRYKDYRRDGADRQRTMTLSPDEFIRRFLLHVLPKGFHRIRHYGLLASAGRKANVARARELLAVPARNRGRGRRSAAGSASAMPLLRRSHGRHRDLPACGSGARATIVASLYRDDGVVTRHDEPQPPVEAVPLRPVGRHAPASIATPTIALMTARSACPPPSHRACHRRTARPTAAASKSQLAITPPPVRSHRSSNPHNVAPVPRGFVLGRFPYAGPMPTPTCDGRHPKTFSAWPFKR